MTYAGFNLETLALPKGAVRNHLESAEGNILVYIAAVRQQLDAIERAVHLHEPTFPNRDLVTAATEVYASCRMREVLLAYTEPPKETP